MDTHNLARGLRLVYYGVCLLFVGGILLTVVTELKAEKFASPQGMWAAVVLLLPAGLCDVSGRLYCLSMPAGRESLQWEVRLSLGLSLFGPALLAGFAVAQSVGVAWTPFPALWFGPAASVAGSVVFIDFLRQVAQKIDNAKLFWHAVTLLGMCALTSALLVVAGVGTVLTAGPQPSSAVIVAGIAAAALAFITTIQYANLLTYLSAAVRAWGERPTPPVLPGVEAGNH